MSLRLVRFMRSRADSEEAGGTSRRRAPSRDRVAVRSGPARLGIGSFVMSGSGSGVLLEGVGDIAAVPLACRRDGVVRLFAFRA